MAQATDADTGRDIPLSQRTGEAPSLTNAGIGVLRPYQAAVNSAAQNKKDAATAIAAAQRALASTPEQIGGYPDGKGGTVGAEANPAYKAANDQLLRAVSIYDSAAREHQKALDALADATAKEAAKAEPAYRQTMQAAADKARTDADQAAAEYKEWSEAAPERKASVAASQRLSSIQADQAQLNIDFQRETDPTRRQALEQQVQANAIALQQAQADAQVATQTVGTRVTAAQQGVRQGEQALTAGEIGIQTSQANLADLLRRIRQAPTDEQAQQALEQALQQGGANLEATRQGTASAQALLPGQVAQQEATLEGTRASTTAQRAQVDAAKQGTLYGLDDYIAQQKDAIAKGLISAQEADRALQARIGGTDVYTATQATEAAQNNRTNQDITQRGQDSSLVGQRLGTFGSMANNALNQFGALNSFVQPGSDVAGRGYLGAMNLAMQGVNAPQFQPPPRVPQAPMPAFLQQFGGQQAPAPGPAAPATNAPITINIGAPPPAAPPAPSGFTPRMGESADASQARNMSAMPALLNRNRPATPDDVNRIWGRAPAGGGPY